MAIQTTRVTSKGQVTIPKAVRQRLGIGQGTRVAFHVSGERVELRVVAVTPIAESDTAFGILRSRRKPVPAEFDPASMLKARGR